MYFECSLWKIHNVPSKFIYLFICDIPKYLTCEAFYISGYIFYYFFVLVKNRGIKKKK